MTLVKCEECGHVVSTLAAICPNCGAPGPAAAPQQAVAEGAPTETASDPPQVPPAQPAARAARGAVVGPAQQPKAAAESRAAWTTRLIVYAVLCVVVLVAIALVTRTVVIRWEVAPARTGYLWWENSRTDKVGIFSEARQVLPADLQEARDWESRGEACLVDPGTPAQLASGKHPMWTTVSVEAVAGRCAGFSGWVPMAAWQDAPP